MVESVTDSAQGVVMERPHPQTGRCRPAQCRQTRYHMFTHAPRRLWANSSLRQIYGRLDISLDSTTGLNQQLYSHLTNLQCYASFSSNYIAYCVLYVRITVTNSRQWRVELLQCYTDKTVCLDSNYDAPVMHGCNNIVGLHNTIYFYLTREQLNQNQEST